MKRFGCCLWLGLLGSGAVLFGSSHASAGIVTVDDGVLQAPDEGVGHAFGFGLAVDQDLAVIGAPSHVSAGTTGGAAYVVRRDANGWGDTTTLLASDPQDDHRFGTAVAVASGDVLVGAHHDATGEWAVGAVYVYRYDGVSWQEVQKITPNDGVFDGRFGIDIDTTGTTALFGTRAGAAYVYVHDGTDWQLEQKLTSSAGEDERFGSKVAIDGDVAVLGAPTETTAVGEEGAAYVFTRSGTTWTEAQKLVAWSGAPYDIFGDAVAVDGDTLYVGAPFDDEGGADAGAVYVFKLEAGMWVQDVKLVPPDIAAGDEFGSSLSLHGDVGIVGAPFADDSAVSAGAAFLYQQVAGAWTMRSKVLHPSGASDDNVGHAVVTDGNSALVGAPGDDDTVEDAGTVFAFLLRLENGDPCVGDGECASGFCVDGVCCESACEGGASASCRACSVAAGADEDGVCGYASTTTVCAAATCSGATEVQPESLCDGQGTCVAPDVAACEAGYLCKDDACSESCADADDCAAGYWCDESDACVELGASGDACSDGSQCSSGWCVDGVCCDGACEDGTCETGTCETGAGGTGGGGSGGSGGAAGTAGSAGESGAAGTGPSSASATEDDDDGGCGCSTLGAPTTAGAWWLLALTGLLGLRRRRES